MISLQTLMAEVKNLKPIPAVAGQLLAVADQPDSSMADIAKVIQYDPVITAGVLRTCNSAYFGMKHPVESIKDAVNLLGIDQVKDLGFSAVDMSLIIAEFGINMQEVETLLQMA